ncbi:Bromodomain-containing protein [Xylariaceae sp. FL0255]|nr:Bromodomain-containing protein [Xylariaceae sp. FL0255]
MENKRKSSRGSSQDTGADDRAAKRRKVLEEFGDLSKGETPQSTTAFGLSILESIRATTDKNGRPVSPLFEELPSRAENPEYYKKIRLPLSLETIERRLKDHGYDNLSTLEGDFKRLVTNAKETHDRNSTIFNDAERLRKAVSNLMVKFNPAYKAGINYQAVATPLPPEPEHADGEADHEHGEMEPPEMEPLSQDAEEEEEEEGAKDAEEEEDQDEDQIDEEEEEEYTNKGSRSRGRRGSSRRKSESQARRTSTTPAQKVVPRGNKADSLYEDVPFKGLNFQQAQEKVVEELLRKKDEPDYPYFEPFIYLPPRTLKDYYEVIAEPLSLKALQKQVRGQHGRSEATYLSDFKSWAAFEDQASLIWKNAYHYNEDGSEIFAMAQELEEMFHDLIKEAKADVPDPPQPKIKLKVASTTEAPAPPKKITIHVGGKTSVAGSPAPPTGRSTEGEASRNGTPVNRNPFGGASSGNAPVNLSQLEKARSLSASAGPPSPSTAAVAKPEEPSQLASVPHPPPATQTTFQQFAPVVTQPQNGLPNGNAAQYYQPPVPAPPPPPPPRSPADILEAQKYRPQRIKESEALFPKLIITSHPHLQIDNRMAVTVQASATEYQQELVLNAPANQFRIQLKPHIASFLEVQEREWRLNVVQDGMRLYPSSVPYERKGEPVFDASLRYGPNRFEVTLVAALPKGEKGPTGLTMEMERMVVHFNLLRH